MYSQYGQEIRDTSFTARRYTNQSADDKADRTRIGVFHEWQADTVAFDDLKWTLDWQNSKSTQKTWDTFQMIVGSIPVSTSNRLKTYSYEENTVQADVVLNKAFETGSVNHYVTYGLNFEDKVITNDNKGIDTDTGDDLTGESAVTNWMPKVGLRSFGLFAQNEMGFMDDRLIVTPGVRYDRFMKILNQPRVTKVPSCRIKVTGVLLPAWVLCMKSMIPGLPSHNTVRVTVRQICLPNTLTSRK